MLLTIPLDMHLLDLSTLAILHHRAVDMRQQVEWANSICFTDTLMHPALHLLVDLYFTLSVISSYRS
jgi:hypothetical protein